jgi:hypothetical protein
VLGLNIGLSEDIVLWREFLQGLVARGVRGVKLRRCWPNWRPRRPNSDRTPRWLFHHLTGRYLTHNVDRDRNIDYGPDNLPIGVELLGVSNGVDLTDLPQRADLARLLAEAHLPGWDSA